MNDEFIPYFEDESSKLRPGLPIVERKTINAILWDSATHEVLCLAWKKYGWRTFIVGGVEEGESTIFAALREIREETGYTDIDLITGLGSLCSGYFAAHKGENRVAHVTGLLFELRTDERVVVPNVDLLPHTFCWVPVPDVHAFINLSAHRYLWELAQGYLA